MGGDKAIRSSFTVTEVVGEADLGYIRHLLEEKCGVHLTEIDASSECNKAHDDFRN